MSKPVKPISGYAVGETYEDLEAKCWKLEHELFGITEQLTRANDKKNTYFRICQMALDRINDLKHKLGELQKAYDENDKKWQSDYGSLIVKYELLKEKELEK